MTDITDSGTIIVSSLEFSQNKENENTTIVYKAVKICNYSFTF